MVKRKGVQLKLLKGNMTPKMLRTLKKNGVNILGSLAKMKCELCGQNISLCKC